MKFRSAREPATDRGGRGEFHSDYGAGGDCAEIGCKKDRLPSLLFHSSFEIASSMSPLSLVCVWVNHIVFGLLMLDPDFGGVRWESYAFFSTPLESARSRFVMRVTPMINQEMRE